jgi:hypothetical protein
LSSFEVGAPVVFHGLPTFSDLLRFYGYHFGYHRGRRRHGLDADSEATTRELTDRDIGTQGCIPWLLVPLVIVGFSVQRIDSTEAGKPELPSKKGLSALVTKPWPKQRALGCTLSELGGTETAVLSSADRAVRGNICRSRSVLAVDGEVTRR